MFLDLPGQSDSTNRQISTSSVDWWHQIGLGGPGTCLTPCFMYLLKMIFEILLYIFV